MADDYYRKRAKYERRDAIDAAGRLYEQFTGMPADEIVSAHLQLPRALTMIGTVRAIAYETVREGQAERYVHEFRSRSRPLLAVSPDGTQLFLVGGNYCFGDRGIIDR